MNSVPRPLAFLALATVVASATASALVSQTLGPTSRAAEVAAPGPSPLAGGLTAELAALRAVLEDLRREGFPASEVVLSRPDDARREAGQPAPASLDLVAAILHLETTLREELAATRDLLGGAVRGQRPEDRPRSIDWQALQEEMQAIGYAGRSTEAPSGGDG